MHFNQIMKKLIFYAAIGLLSQYSFAQKSSLKLGNVDPKIIELSAHPIDTSADAVVLKDIGITYFIYSSEKGFSYQFQRTKQIKILTKDGLEYADIFIPYYNSGSAEERVSGIKGYTYNFENGKVRSSKLEKGSIYKEATSKNVDQMKISMPDVKPGSVIEINYTVVSPFIGNLVTWYFQDEIPTVFSEYRLSVPEYFDYQFLNSGYHPMAVNEHTTQSDKLIFNSKSRQTAGLTTETSFQSSSLTYLKHNYHWVAQNVPAFTEEAYMASSTDYLSKMEFELRGTNYPNQGYEARMGTWASLNETFSEDQDFSAGLGQIGFLKSYLEPIAQLENDQEKIAAVVALVNKHIAWDDRNTRYISSSLKNAWNDQVGGTGDINLCIVACLRKLGIESDPVLVSTRGHGKINEQFAISKQFNTVIALAQTEQGVYLLDGTDRFMPAGVLPKRYLNGQGWRVSEASPGWIPLTSSAISQAIVQADLVITEEGGLAGTVKLTEKGYAGFASHKKMKFSGEEKFYESFQDLNDDWLIEEYNYVDESDISAPFKSDYMVEMNEDLTLAGDRIYFNPTLDEVMSNNPFKVENRNYPVDYAYPIRRTYMFKFTLPEGYEVEEIPQSTAFQLPDRAAIFKYNMSTIGNSLQIMADFKINRSMFSQIEYPMLKEFYDMVVKKCSEQVVIKKTAQP